MSYKLASFLRMLVILPLFLVGCSGEKRAETQPPPAEPEPAVEAPQKPDTVQQIPVETPSGDTSHVERNQFYSNGQLQEHWTEVLAADGAYVKDGLYESWYSDGQRKSQANYVLGEIEGTMLNWHKNGQTASEIPYTGGVISGHTVYYYDNGQKQSEGKYVDGKQDGPWTAWYDDGTVMQTAEMSNGRINGTKITYYPNGRKESEATFIDGQLQGDILEWDEDGNPAEGQG